MSDIVQLLPQEARKHYINLRNMRDSSQQQQYNQKLTELKIDASRRGIAQSGWVLKQTSQLQKELIDSRVYGHIEDAIATCNLYDVPLTAELCKALEELARSVLIIQHQRGPHLQPIGGFNFPVGAADSFKQEWEHSQLKALPQIAVLIEAARIADERKRNDDMAKLPAYKAPKQYAVGTKVRITMPGIDGVVIQMDSERGSMNEYWHTIETKYGVRREPGSILQIIPEPITHNQAHGLPTYVQNVTQHGTGNSVSQFGDVNANIIKAGDLSMLKQELAAIRATLKARPESLDADEALGSLAAAERAASNHDEHGVRTALGRVSKGGWELIKGTAPAIASQLLLHFLKEHGLVS